MPTQLDVALGRRGENWCEYTAKAAMQPPDGMPAQDIPAQVGVCGPQGGFWIDPAALATLKAGTVIDDDPVTHIRSSVDAVDAQSVRFVYQGPGVNTIAVFAKSDGVLTSTQSTRANTGMTTTLQLQDRN
ncbi:MAG: hypothetical protein QM770_08665 [Tepidisphaeraceae bacterium]